MISHSLMSSMLNSFEEEDSDFGSSCSGSEYSDDISGTGCRSRGGSAHAGVSSSAFVEAESSYSGGYSCSSTSLSDLQSGGTRSVADTLCSDSPLQTAGRANAAPLHQTYLASSSNLQNGLKNEDRGNSKKIRPADPLDTGSCSEDDSVESGASSATDDSDESDESDESSRPSQHEGSGASGSISTPLARDIVVEGMNTSEQSQTSFVSVNEAEVHEDCHSVTESGSDTRKAQEVKKLIGHEEKRVRSWRMLVIMMFLLLGAFLVASFYLLLSNRQVEEQRTAFSLSAHDIEEGLASSIADMHKLLQRLSEQLTIQSKAANSSFPYVTLPYFEAPAGSARREANVEWITYSPLVWESQRNAWGDYVVAQQNWITQGNEIMAQRNESATFKDQESFVYPFIYSSRLAGRIYPSEGPGPFLPVWHQSPPPHSRTEINFDLASVPAISSALESMAILNAPVFSEVADTRTFAGPLAHSRANDLRPMTLFLEPVRDEFAANREGISGALVASISWEKVLGGFLPDGLDGVVLVLVNTCGQNYTFELTGSEIHFVGEGDLHDTDFDDFSSNVTLFGGHCMYSVVVFSSDTVKQQFENRMPLVMSCLACACYLCVVVAFVAYDRYVQKRSNNIAGKAAHAKAIVSSLYPSNVIDRLFDEDGGGPGMAETEDLLKDNAPMPQSTIAVPLQRMDSSGMIVPEPSAAISMDTIPERTSSTNVFKTKPIADLFPRTTIMFADIAGFTAWSSLREPSQVFTLLETIYHAFDVRAKKHGVFKVETVGDCYVAVTGLPEPRDDHAVAMTKFAIDCMKKTKDVTKKLAFSLGPDTCDLAMRMGLHSGAVTAGVLRGEKSRFQLFGDTMNTASRVETTGERECIHISKDTANLLAEAGKEHWFFPREDKVYAKGKGEMQTYWIKIGGARGKGRRDSTAGDMSQSDVSDMEFTDSETEESSTEDSDEYCKSDFIESMMSEKTARLVDWNFRVLNRMLAHLVAWRNKTGFDAGDRSVASSMSRASLRRNRNPVIFAEVKKSIPFPEFDPEATVVGDEDINEVHLEQCVVDELKDYIVNIAIMYKDNPFHNFEHASHIVMSIEKRLARIFRRNMADGESVASLYDRTYGIAADPMSQFACAFAALIHDVGHEGVTNAQLIKEGASIVRVYNEKSVAEQNSFNLAWDLFVDRSYADLRSAICPTETELTRFRQLVVNLLIATDISDKELKETRTKRWDQAFGESSKLTKAENNHLRATLVIEHMMQASDVAHTMQHWQVYRKWNEALFEELYKAFMQGRAEKNPADFWYDGELGFFEFYVIPLAQKLKDCGVFGIGAEESYVYAVENRREWETNGKQIVTQLAEKYKNSHAPGRSSELSRRTSAAPGGNNQWAFAMESALSSLMQKALQVEEKEGDLKAPAPAPASTPAVQSPMLALHKLAPAPEQAPQPAPAPLPAAPVAATAPVPVPMQAAPEQAPQPVPAPLPRVPVPAARPAPAATPATTTPTPTLTLEPAAVTTNPSVASRASTTDTVLSAPVSVPAGVSARPTPVPPAKAVAPSPGPALNGEGQHPSTTLESTRNRKFPVNSKPEISPNKSSIGSKKPFQSSTRGHLINGSSQHSDWPLPDASKSTSMAKEEALIKGALKHLVPETKAANAAFLSSRQKSQKNGIKHHGIRNGDHSPHLNHNVVTGFAETNTSSNGSRSHKLVRLIDKGKVVERRNGKKAPQAANAAINMANDTAFFL